MRTLPTISDQEAERDAIWLAATEAQGLTQAALADLVGLSQGQVSRRLARARKRRDEMPTPEPTPGPSELPRLELTDGEGRITTRTDSTSSGLCYSLRSDAVSLDGGSTWIPADDPSTPRMTVLASDHTGRGSRKHRLEPRPFQSPPEPPGPTSHRRTPGLKGGRG